MLYPNEDLINSIDLIDGILKEEAILKVNYVNDILLFVDFIKKNELIYLQENYVSLFDRRKSFSLYLFEHIHGDSRDRGMAMVDLKNLYTASNFDIPIGGELPDYIPVFLEYLSILPLNKAADLLGEIINIIAILGNRLKVIDSIYYVIFLALESLSSVTPDHIIVKKALSEVLNDKSVKLVDKNWEDTKIF